MTNIQFTETAKKDFLKLDNSLQRQFKKAILKLRGNPFRKHLKYGIPFHVINVTKQSRIIYDVESDENIIILHCFGSHKDYEIWYKSYK